MGWWWVIDLVAVGGIYRWRILFKPRRGQVTLWEGTGGVEASAIQIQRVKRLDKIMYIPAAGKNTSDPPEKKHICIFLFCATILFWVPTGLQQQMCPNPPWNILQGKVTNQVSWMIRSSFIYEFGSGCLSSWIVLLYMSVKEFRFRFHWRWKIGEWRCCWHIVSTHLYSLRI